MKIREIISKLLKLQDTYININDDVFAFPHQEGIIIAFNSKDEDTSSMVPRNTGKEIQYILFQLEVERSPISQNSIERVSRLDIAKRSVTIAEKKKLTATPASNKSDMGKWDFLRDKKYTKEMETKAPISAKTGKKGTR